ncbi:hypothetical protein [Aurantimonas sp. Leaf443]|uniref:hypothetical protein n=1 Tax=Aurantimonas sp. Leaf443 TaxID=1736378 RepID=UPI0006F351C1|nr:hypothetical protein [Aurantimonas sp. Leaf443]KQT88195.1 hypothetical protein ASG48_01785 [Aurantimonas sp. Leaf443]
MPQIWVTYEEAGALLECLPTVARVHSIAANWDRRKSLDGRTRVKLPPAEMQIFLDRYVAAAQRPQMPAPPLDAASSVARTAPPAQARAERPGETFGMPAAGRFPVAGLFG